MRAFADNTGAVANLEAVIHETPAATSCGFAHDDWIEPRYLERCVGVLETRPDFVVAFADMNVVDDTGEAVRVLYRGVPRSSLKERGCTFPRRSVGSQGPDKPCSLESRAVLRLSKQA